MLSRWMIARCLLLVGLICWAGAGLKGDETSDDELAASVDARLDEWRISPKERAVDQIGWSANVLEANELAREHQRPVFLFTYDGRMTIGRC